MAKNVSRKEAILHDRKMDLIVDISDYFVETLNITEKTAEAISEVIADNKKTVISILKKKKQ